MDLMLKLLMRVSIFGNISSGATTHNLRLLGVTGIDNLKPFHLFQTKISNMHVMISRTGFTGDLGYEIL